MRSVSGVLILVVVAMPSATPTSDKRHYDVSNATALFEDFIKKYNRNYKDDADKDEHFRAFAANLEEINKSNASDRSATYVINEFADYTEDEWKNMMGSSD